MTFEVIWIYYDRAINNLITSYTIWKTKTRRIKCRSFHFLKIQQIKMNYIGNAKGRNFLGAKPTSDEFCHKFGRKLWFLKFFDMLSESLRDICMTSPELLANLEIAEFCDWTRKQFFWQTTDKNFEKINYCYSAITQLIKRKLQYIVIKILLILNVMLYKQWNKRSLHIYVPIINQAVFIFGHLAANPPFWTRLSSFHDRVYQKGRALKVSKCNFSERATSYELCAIARVLWNLAHIKIYPLVRDQARWIQWPVKMATGHFSNCSHNFAWRGVINHDRMITLTLQTKYDTILQSGYPKFAYPLEISFWIRSLFTHGLTFSGRFAIGSETIGCRFGVVYRDVTTGSRESRVHHYDAPSFTEFWNLYCPRTMHFS